MNQGCFFFFLSFFFSYAVLAQPSPIIKWVKRYGHAKSDVFRSIIENNQGNLIAVGSTSKAKNKDLFFAIINPSNGLPLEDFKYFDTGKEEEAYQIIQTLDKGYAIVGYSKNKKGARRKALLIQLDALGNEQQSIFFNEGDDNVFYDIVQDNKGNLYVSGKAGNKACLVKYDSNGKKQWHKFFDLDGKTEGVDLKLTPKGNLLLAIHQVKHKKHSTLLECLTTDTISIWKKSFPNIKITDAYIEKEGAISLSGILYSPKKEKKEDLFIFKIDALGKQVDTIITKINDSGKDGANALLKSRDGYYYTAGYNTSFELNVNLSKLWVYKVTDSGKEVNSDYFIEGGKLKDIAYDIIELKDGSILVAGTSASTKSFSSLEKGGAFLIKLLPEGYSPPIRPTIEVEEKQPIVDNTLPSITLLNKFPDKIADYQYKTNQSLAVMNLRAVHPNSRRSLSKMNYAYALNDSAYKELTITKEKSNPSRLSKREKEIDFDPFELSLNKGKNIIFIKIEEEIVAKYLIEYQPAFPNLHLVSIGIPDAELDYTIKDARDFAKAFYDSESTKKLFNSIKVDTLTNKTNTKEGDIKYKFDKLNRMEVKENDYVILFISAHGRIYDNQLIIPAADYKAKDFDALYFKKDILQPLKRLKCKKIIFIDACHSGKGVKGANATAEELLNISETSNDFYIMSSSSANQKSYENKDWGNGAFTKALLEAFRNELVEIDGEFLQANTNDAYLTLDELFIFVNKRVSFLANTKNKQQTPHINKPLSELDFRIFQHEKH